MEKLQQCSTFHVSLREDKPFMAEVVACSSSAEREKLLTRK
jgi:hypothetical protein